MDTSEAGESENQRDVCGARRVLAPSRDVLQRSMASGYWGAAAAGGRRTVTGLSEMAPGDTNVGSRPRQRQRASISNKAPETQASAAQ